ncbi:cardiolipin synthase [Zongyangia hominis]|uniref:Cardiolipin synthase n=1 Tax=Zongyangia hominis TaxID=2763677 RepID=A0A926I786_9FIRM|nr:cardiolipin synthase [Zongyangia hominis]MBC8570824.1 cardiolipin synthase [Zongyangia hominis]
MLRKVSKFLSSRLFLFALLIVVQFLFLVFSVFYLSRGQVFLYTALELCSVIAVIWIVGKADNPSYKLAWAIPILLFPLFGGLFYLFLGNHRVGKKLSDRLEFFERAGYQQVEKNEAVFSKLKSTSKHLSRQAEYIGSIAAYPVWQGTTSTYFSIGEEMFEALKTQLERAEKFIFMEYFIVESGVMFDSILAILRRKASEGVEVRFIYDDLGSISTLPSHYYRQLKGYGIKACVFNPFTPVLSPAINYRDHRKICVVDGNVGFTGGINLADEYINAIVKHGHWKDSGVMIEGQAVWNLTMMFLQIWNFTTGESDDYEQYRPVKVKEDDGFIQPFGDVPLDRNNISEYAYMQIINGSYRYVYIMTPYLIIDNEMSTALIMAAQSGVDVRIITPHIADKWYVHLVTQANYPRLIKNGIKIYEYTPGFVHAKNFVADDEVAIVGTANMDFRSFYLHFECGCAFFRNSAVQDVKRDFLETLRLCQPITLEECKKQNPFKTLLQALLKMFAPLM